MLSGEHEAGMAKVAEFLKALVLRGAAKAGGTSCSNKDSPV
jgi:hypothetical protein